MNTSADEMDPVERARDSTEFFGPPVHLGRQTHVRDAVVTNDTTGRTIALFGCTQMVLSPR
jgi:acyl-coenzyme A thioesterase PaaI-like protein